MPRHARNTAADRPARPPPTINTEVFAVSIACPDRNTTYLSIHCIDMYGIWSRTALQANMSP